MNNYTFYLDEETVKILELIAKAKFGDDNKSAAIRWIVREWLEKQEKAS